MKMTEEQKLAKKDKLMKTKYGHKYRSDIWCHSNVGDDYIARIYTDIIPSKKEMKEAMGRIKFEENFTTTEI